MIPMAVLPLTNLCTASIRAWFNVLGVPARAITPSAELAMKSSTWLTAQHPASRITERELLLMKMRVAKNLSLGLLGLAAPLCGAQVPSGVMSGGYEVVFTLKADIPDPEKPEDVNHISFQITRQMKGETTVSSSKNLTFPGQNERVIIGKKDDYLYNVDPIEWTKQGHFVRFERTPRGIDDALFEPSYRINHLETAKLLADHPAVNGKSKFEIGGNTYELEIDPDAKLVSKATIHFATGAVFEKTASGFKKFGELVLPAQVISKENFNPVVETKTYTLVSARPITKLVTPFTKDTLPEGSKVSDKIEFKQYVIDANGKWVEIGNIKKPNYAQNAHPDKAAKAVLFVGVVGAALSLLGTTVFIQKRKALELKP